MGSALLLWLLSGKSAWVPVRCRLARCNTVESTRDLRSGRTQAAGLSRPV